MEYILWVWSQFQHGFGCVVGFGLGGRLYTCVRALARERLSGVLFCRKVGICEAMFFFSSLFGFLLPLKIYPKIQSLNVDFVVEPIFYLIDRLLSYAICC